MLFGVSLMLSAAQSVFEFSSPDKDLEAFGFKLSEGNNGVSKLAEIGADVRHVVRRHSDNSELFLKVRDREFVTCKEADVRDLLPAFVATGSAGDQSGCCIKAKGESMYLKSTKKSHNYGSRKASISST